MSLVKPLALQSLTMQDLIWLGRGGQRVGWEPRDYVDRVARGIFDFWRVGDFEPQGVLVTELREAPQGDELYIHMLAGEGLVRIKIDLMHDIASLARDKGCRFLSCEAKGKVLTKLYERMGFEPVAVRMIQEI